MISLTWIDPVCGRCNIPKIKLKESSAGARCCPVCLHCAKFRFYFIFKML